MHLGIDLGTTRTVVAYADRGNFPVVGFFDTDGDVHEYFPSLLAWDGHQLLSGFAAQRAAACGVPSLRSVKRLLAEPQLGTSSQVTIGSQTFLLIDVLTRFLADLRHDLTTTSTLAVREDFTIDSVVVAVPAHAHSAQRFLTLEAFQRSGFPVRAMLNEPSAAAFEYTHRQGSISARRNRLIVYDLGGGTFDASRLDVHDRSHAVLGTVGINHLGGDDFDEVLARLAIAQAGEPDLSPAERDTLLLDAQVAKEGLAPQSKRITVDVAGRPVIVPVSDFYQALTPLVEQTVSALAPLVSQLDDGEADLSEIAGLYLVGGASSLPIVPRLLRERFGRRVQRSAYPAASTAIGLAIAADPDSGYTLADRVSRGFGVFREQDGGLTLAFDAIFDREQAASPLTGQTLQARRSYRPEHNVGWFRFVEYAELVNHQPSGELVPFATVVFPYDRQLQHDPDPASKQVVRTGPGDLIEELYSVDQHGIISVQITDLDTGYCQRHELRFDL